MLLLTYLLTTWRRVILEKLIGLQLVKKFLAFYGTRKVHYRTHKRQPSVPILGQPNPVHIPTSHLLEIHPNIIHPSTPRSPRWSLSLRFPYQDPIRPPLLTHARHVPSPCYGLVYLQRKHPASKCFLTGLFHREGPLVPRQPQSWRTTPCRLSTTVYSIYSQLPSTSGVVPLFGLLLLCLN